MTRTRALPDTEWRADGGVGSNGDCGGDIQAGDSYSVRYVRPDRPRSMITVTFYPVEYDELPGEFVVQRQVEWLVCEDPSDPGGTEVWSDCDYSDVSDCVDDSAPDAEREAREFAEAAQDCGWTHDWDGYSDPRAQYRPQGDHWACWRCGCRQRGVIETGWATAVRCWECGQPAEAA